MVVTYDPTHGRQLFVNGVFTGDVDTVKGGTLGNWDNTFAFLLGNETSGDRPWQGEIRFAAVHNKALTHSADPAELRGRRRRSCSTCCSMSAR